MHITLLHTCIYTRSAWFLILIMLMHLGGTSILPSRISINIQRSTSWTYKQKISCSHIPIAPGPLVFATNHIITTPQNNCLYEYIYLKCCGYYRKIPKYTLLSACFFSHKAAKTKPQAARFVYKPFNFDSHPQENEPKRSRPCSHGLYSFKVCCTAW